MFFNHGEEREVKEEEKCWTKHGKQGGESEGREVLRDFWQAGSAVF